MYRKTYEILNKNQIEIHSSFVGEYVTSLEMNGASITLMKLDEELQPLLERETFCSMFRVQDKIMKWIGTSWKMNNNIVQTHRYIDTLVRNKKYLKKKILIFL